MELKFIGQGLNPESDITVGNYIADSLESKNYNSLDAFVAFVSTSGLANIMGQLISFKEMGGVIKLFCGVDLNATSKEALQQLLSNNIESYIVYSPNKIIYHPKVYAFKGNSNKRTIIGSSNLTERGLFQNIEASVCIDFNNDDEKGNEFMSDIYDYYNSIINHTHTSCQLLTENVLNVLVESKVVLSEAENRAKTNRINKEFGQKESKVNSRLLELFEKVNAKRPPKGFSRSVTKKELVENNENEEIKVIDETIDLPSGAMWIETGLMTGGSRNILDLSKKGKLNGVNKFGSVSFFGINPDDESQFKDINIIFGGKKYESNRIFYTKGNSNWRIRLNGETADNEKLTSFSIPSLGENGGFQKKLLLFTKINDEDYRLEILELDLLSQLIENSSDWARGGNGVGRAYGIISD